MIENTEVQRRFFPGVDGLRVFAALSVLMFHATGADGFAEVPSAWPFSWIRGGWVGLDIFFVVSGLVVGQSALAGYAQRGRAFRSEFIRHRIARIMPLYLVTLIACALFLIRPWSPLLAWQAFTHVVFLHNLWPDTIMAINAPAWSLGVEVQLYALLLLLTPWLTRKPAPVVAVSALAFALCYRAAVVATILTLDPANTALMQHLSYQTPGMTDSFGLGAATSIFLSRIDATSLKPAWCVGFIVCGLIALSAGSIVTSHVIDGSIWANPPYAISMRTGIALAACVLVVGCAQLPSPTNVTVRKILRHGGDLSYGIYLWHFVALTALQKTTSLTGWPLVVAVLFLTVCLAELTYRVLEAPVMRWSKNRPTLSVA